MYAAMGCLGRRIVRILAAGLPSRVGMLACVHLSRKLAARLTFLDISVRLTDREEDTAYGQAKMKDPNDLLDRCCWGHCEALDHQGLFRLGKRLPASLVGVGATSRWPASFVGFGYWF